MNIRKIPFVARLMLAFTILLRVVHADEVPAAMAAAAELKQDTIQAFDYYMKITEEDREARLRRSAMFLWIDREPDAPPKPVRKTQAR
jgi:hypothetical protein